VARLQAKSLERPDEVRPTPFGRVDIYNLDDLGIGRMTFEPAADSGLTFVDAGTHELRGVSGARQLYALAP